MPPMFTVWWLRPDRSAARVGEHNAVVWNRLKQSPVPADRKSTRLNSSHLVISYAVFCLKKKNRIAIARVALRDAPILLPDELPRVLDVRAERNGVDALDLPAAVTTSIVIAPLRITLRLT